MSILADIWTLTTEHPVTMGAIYATLALIVAAGVLIARRS